MTAETRDFTDTLANAPNGVFRLEYTYTQGGQLKSLKDPYGEQINYAHDKLSRLSTVTGSSFGGVTSYASSPHYRAWGGLQSLSFGNATSMSVEFDTRLRPAAFELVKSGQQDPIMEKTYEYHSDGRLRKLSDAVDDRFDRLNEYDQMGRITSARTGLEARGGTPTTQPEIEAIPYRQSYEYNAFGNTTERVNDMWGTHNFSAERTFVNNRIQNQSQTVWEYDADGRITDNGGATLSTYNAAGQLIVYNRQLVPAGENEVTRHYNGDGMEEKRTQRILKEIEPEEWEWEQQPAKYYIRSTVLGGAVVTDVYDIGTKKRTYVRAGGQEIAWQNGDSGGSVVFQATDPVGASIRSAESDGDIFDAQGTESSPAELDPMGGNVATENPFVTQTGGSSCVGCGLLDEEDVLFVNGQRQSFALQGLPISREEAESLMQAGSAYPCPNNYCGAGTARNHQTGETAVTSPYQVFADGVGGRWVAEVTGSTIVDPNGNSTKGDYGVTGWHWREDESDTKLLVFANKHQLKCPERSKEHSFPAKDALDHYIGGSGRPVYISIDEITADFPLPSSFEPIRNLVQQGTQGGTSITHRIENIHSGPMETKGWQGAVLGRITFDLTGTLKIYEWGLTEFEGTIGVIPDIYDFDKGDRTVAKQISTYIGKTFPGKPYDIITLGRYDVQQSWNKYATLNSSCK
ncbi:MAG: lipid II-degrading bacteriocin [Chloracidobacterium sp.]|nr:lipid II-degrading bacteriocin [Chloracidobacterium sp.]